MVNVDVELEVGVVMTVTRVVEKLDKGGLGVVGEYDVLVELTVHTDELGVVGFVVC